MKQIFSKLSCLALVISLIGCLEPTTRNTTPKNSTPKNSTPKFSTPAKFQAGPVDYKIALKQANQSAKLLKFQKKDPTADQFRAKFRELVINLLANSNPVTRRQSAQTLGDLRKKAAYKPLSIAITDPDVSVRNAVAKALGQIGEKKGAYILANSIADDSDKSVRLSAAISLAKLKNPKTSASLRKHMNSSDTKLAIACIRGLGYLRDKQAANKLIELYKSSKNIRVRATAISAIGQISPKNANLILTEALTDSAELVRYQALCALGKIGDKNLLPKIKPLLKDYNSSVRKAAVNAIKQIEAKNN